jgi:hypothetical protein
VLILPYSLPYQRARSHSLLTHRLVFLGGGVRLEPPLFSSRERRMRLIVSSALAKLFIGQGRCIAQKAVLLMNENRIWGADRNSLDTVYTSS